MGQVLRKSRLMVLSNGSRRFCRTLLRDGNQQLNRHRLLGYLALQCCDLLPEFRDDAFLCLNSVSVGHSTHYVPERIEFL